MKSTPLRGELELDPEILARLSARDPVLLRDLFTEINPYLLKVCGAQGVYGEAAGDLLQSTWERFFFQIEKFEGRSQIRTFICGILINKIREHRRALKRIVFEEDSEGVMERVFTEDGWWKAEPEDPARLLGLRQAGKHVEDCMEGLSDQQKTAFVLREVEDEEPDEVCKMLGVSTSHLRVLIFRAKEKLRLCLQGKAVSGVDG